MFPLSLHRSEIIHPPSSTLPLGWWFLLKQSRPPSPCRRWARSLPQVAPLHQPAAFCLVHWPLHPQDENVMRLRHKRGAGAAFHRCTPAEFGVNGFPKDWNVNRTVRGPSSPGANSFCYSLWPAESPHALGFNCFTG